MKHIRRNALDEVKTLIPPDFLRDQFKQLVEPIHEYLRMLDYEIRLLEMVRDLLLPRLISGEINAKRLVSPILSD